MKMTEPNAILDTPAEFRPFPHPQDCLCVICKGIDLQEEIGNNNRSIVMKLAAHVKKSDARIAELERWQRQAFPYIKSKRQDLAGFSSMFDGDRKKLDRLIREADKS